LHIIDVRKLSKPRGGSKKKGGGAGGVFDPAKPLGKIKREIRFNEAFSTKFRENQIRGDA